MLYKQLGRTGLRISALGLGGSTFGPHVVHHADEALTHQIIHRAMDLGVNHLDTADMYSNSISEEYIGRALVGRRPRVVLASKFSAKFGDGPNDYGSSRARMMASVEASLKRLQTDYLDVYYLHVFDPLTPMEESLRGLDDLVRQGKIRYPACSNYAGWQIMKAHWVADRRGYVPFVVVQSKYNLLDRGLERDVVPACREVGMGLVPYYPLAAGVLTGKYKRGEPIPPNTRGVDNANVRSLLTDRNLALVEKLGEFAAARGHTSGELAIAWLVAQSHVSSVITGNTTIEQLEQNVRASEWALTPAEIAEIDRLTLA